MDAQTRAALLQNLTPQEALILDAFQSEVYLPGKMDVQHEPIYDTISFSAGDTVNETTATFFTNVGPIAGKTIAQTNVGQPRRLPAPEAFSCFAIRLAWRENVLLADLLGILYSFAFRLFLGQKAYNTGPIWHYNAGGGISGFAAIDGSTSATTLTVLTNGVPSREAMHKLAIPIVIENQTDFYATLSGGSYTLTASNAGGTGFKIVCLLDGLHARGIQ